MTGEGVELVGVITPDEGDALRWEHAASLVYFFRVVLGLDERVIASVFGYFTVHELAIGWHLLTD